jgi:hypothetical protein
MIEKNFLKIKFTQASVAVSLPRQSLAILRIREEKKKKMKIFMKNFFLSRFHKKNIPLTFQLIYRQNFSFSLFSQLFLAAHTNLSYYNVCKKICARYFYFPLGLFFMPSARRRRRGTHSLHTIAFLSYFYSSFFLVRREARREYKQASKRERERARECVEKGQCLGKS